MTTSSSIVTPLSALDSVYLATETSEAPMHIACLALLDAKPLLTPTGRLRKTAIRRRIAQQWAEVEATHVRLKPKENDNDPHAWEHVADVASCVEFVELPAHSDDRVALDWCAAALSPVLPRDRPLWRIYLLTGLSRDRVGLLFQMHHSLCDGQGAAALLSRIMDSPAEVEKPEEEHVISSDPTGPLPEQVGTPLIGLAAQAVHQLLDVAHKGVNAAKQVVDVVEGVTFLTASTRTRPKTSLNRTISPERHLDVVRVDFETVRAIAHELEVTVNDIMLGMVTGAIRTLLQDRGEDVSRLTLEALVPVSLRRTESDHLFGNQTAVLQVPLPVWEGNARERVLHIHSSTNDRKKHHAAAAVSVLESAASFVPFSLLQPISKLSVHHQSLVNIVITNLRGPTEPLCFLNAQVLSVVPFLPLAPSLPLSVAIGSYNSTLEIGVQSNPQSCPEAAVFASNLLEDLAGILQAR
jgi:diacylglycerol O-acyltransferase / wax synthase